MRETTHITENLSVLGSTPLTEQPMESLVLPGVPPATYIAEVISDLIRYADSDPTESTLEQRSLSRISARQAARIIATLCSPVYTEHLTEAYAALRRSHDIDAARLTELRIAAKGVIAEADRETAAFIRLRAAIGARQPTPEDTDR